MHARLLAGCALLWCTFSMGERFCEVPVGSGVRFQTPYRLVRGLPVMWSVFLTHSTPNSVALEVGLSADALTRRGGLLFPVFHSFSTNSLAPFEGKTLTYQVEKDWLPAHQSPASVLISVGFTNLTTSEMAVNYYRAKVQNDTNSVIQSSAAPITRNDFSP